VEVGGVTAGQQVVEQIRQPRLATSPGVRFVAVTQQVTDLYLIVAWAWL
jgi:hypothetical protein